MVAKDEGRLDRIEQKIDKMSEAIIQMARLEAKIDNYEIYREESWKRMNKFSEKLDSIEKTVDDNHRTVSTINKLFWVVIIAAAGAIATNLWM
jgi:translation initiation factor 2 alpha subunit (eIF-2alpha)